jgi:alkylation response protein AidB-like acyl-CoA dehydrogenase
MDLQPSDDELSIATAAAELITAKAPIAVVRTAERNPAAIDELWSAATDQGWFGLAVSEANGGIGLSLVELSLIFEELGRSLVPGPWVSTAAAAVALADTARGAGLLGGRPTVVGSGEPVTEHDGRLTGELGFVEGLKEGSALVVDVGGWLWWVEPEAEPGVDINKVDAFDAMTSLSTVSLREVAAQPLGVATATLRGVEHLLVAAVAVGAAEGALQLARDYALAREQFGKPLGGFQALAHRLADMAMTVERARALLALAAAESRSESWTPRIRLGARWLATQAALSNATDGILIHGGIGFTWECDAQLYYRRATALSHYGGTTAEGLLDEIVAAT